jgi:hypothetical protein
MARGPRTLLSSSASWDNCPPTPERTSREGFSTGCGAACGVAPRPSQISSWATCQAWRRRPGGRSTPGTFTPCAADPRADCRPVRSTMSTPMVRPGGDSTISRTKTASHRSCHPLRSRRCLLACRRRAASGRRPRSAEHFAGCHKGSAPWPKPFPSGSWPGISSWRCPIRQTRGRSDLCGRIPPVRTGAKSTPTPGDRARSPTRAIWRTRGSIRQFPMAPSGRTMVPNGSESDPQRGFAAPASRTTGGSIRSPDIPRRHRDILSRPPARRPSRRAAFASISPGRPRPPTLSRHYAGCAACGH